MRVQIDDQMLVVTELRTACNVHDVHPDDSSAKNTNRISLVDAHATRSSRRILPRQRSSAYR
jgi:hypothetical protein